MSVILKLIQLPYRLSTGTRSLPDFLLIGAQKSGTTSLFHYLAQHSQVAVNLRKRKETYFFYKDYGKGLGYYRQYFPFRDTPGLVGEGSTGYFHSANVPERVYEALPEARLLLVLANPLHVRSRITIIMLNVAVSLGLLKTLFLRRFFNNFKLVNYRMD